MSITVRCTCGKKYQLKDDAAGKKFKCKECSEVVKVPEEQLDELDDVDDEEDEWDDGELKLPVRKKKKKNSKAVAMAKGIAWEAAKDAPAVVVRIAGIFVGILGVLLMLWSMAFAGAGLVAEFGGGAGGGGFMIFMWGGFLVMTCFLGVKACFGFGLKVSREYVWTGTGSITVGMMVVGFAMVCIALTVFVSAAAVRRARPGIQVPNRAPPDHIRQFRQPGQPAGF